MTKLFSSSNGPCRAVRYVSRAVLFILLCSCGQEEQKPTPNDYKAIQDLEAIRRVKGDSPEEKKRVTLNEHKVITISLPDDTSMRFFPVWLGIDRAERAVTDKRTLDSHTASVSLRDKEKTLAALPAGTFIGKRDGKSERLYYLGETEVQRDQWNSLMGWMDKQEGKKSSIAEGDRKNPKLPRTGVAMDEIYRFIEALNIWAGQDLQRNFSKYSQSFIFFRLPTEAEWDFAARGGINVLERNPECFTHRHPYKNKDEAELRGHEWCKENTYSKVRECGSLPANLIGLKDMLGNVEEITTHLFSSEDKQSHYGKLIICGNNYSNSSHDFTVRRRTKYIGAEEKVGVRIALGSAVRYGIGISKERENQKVTHDLRMKDDFKDQIEKLKGEKEELASELEQKNKKMERWQENVVSAFREIENYFKILEFERQDFEDKNKQLKKQLQEADYKILEIKDANFQLSSDNQWLLSERELCQQKNNELFDSPTITELNKLQGQLRIAESEVNTCQARLRTMELQRPIVVRASESGLQKEIKKLNEELVNQKAILDAARKTISRLKGE